MACTTAVIVAHDLVERIDPELRDAFRRLAPLPDVTADPDAIRKRLAASSRESRREPASDITRTDLVVPGARGVPVRVYGPAARAGRAPAVVWVHGGGFVLGRPADFDETCDRLARATGGLVVSVDYRLAPEHAFPAAVEDVYAVLLWLHDSAIEVGVAAERIALVGASAGGGIAAGATLMARDRGGPPVAFQMPLYACLDDRHTTPSSRLITDPRTWNRDRSIRAWRAYLGGHAAANDLVPYYAAPARAEDLRGLPPTFMMVGELDLTRDENMAFAGRLVRAGVRTEFHLVPGAFHRYEEIVPGAGISVRARALQEDALCRALDVDWRSSARNRAG
jgi:acetyl esterase/lipase